MSNSLRRATGLDDVADAIAALRLEAPSAAKGWWDASRDRNEGPIDLIDMFSGAGGMSAGFRTVNGIFPAFKQILALDIDGPSNATLERNLGVRTSSESVHALAKDTTVLDGLIRSVGRREGAPLVLIGCAPCQGFSSHRKAGEKEDVRNGLFLDFIDVANHLRPDVVIIENVPELLTDRYWPMVAKAKKELTENGYYVHLSVHNMAEFGVPQERFRTLLFASKLPIRPLGGTIDRSSFTTVRNAIGDLPPVPAGVVHPEDESALPSGL